MVFKTAEQAFSLIESFTNLEKSPNLTAREYRLDRMFALCELFDNPQKSFRSIHIAGSKGKGSTAALTAAALAANGLKTGLYCSPHVESYKERISEAGIFFEDRIYAEAASEMLSRIESQTAGTLPGGPPTTFELLTLLAFMIFRKTGCEWAVFETGLGGRLDATNVIIPEAVMLTSIELEHTEYLGNTITDIAAEKAGIIKTGVPVFCAAVEPDAEQVFRSRAEKCGSEIFFPGDLIKSLEKTEAEPPAVQAARIELGSGSIYDLALLTAGSFQQNNAALAVCCLDYLKNSRKNLFAESFNPSSGIEKTSLPGRMELFPAKEGSPAVLLDGAHTVRSAAAAVKAFEDSVAEAKDSCLIFGAVEGKDVKGMAECLKSFRKIIISKPGSFKKSNPAELYNIFTETLPDAEIILLENPEEALSEAVGSGLPLMVTGSFYMVAEIRKFL